MPEVVSVIIPVYNVKPFLTECINSVINQTYKNIEIILIDDGSTDGSDKICDAYIHKDKRVKVVHQENGGLSVARNTGIDVSTGEYLLFVDADDIIHYDMVYFLHSSLIETMADLSFCRYQIFSIDEEIKMRNIEEYRAEYITGREAVMRMYSEDCADYVITCGKLYKRTYFNKLRFPVGKRHEDEFVTYQVLYYLKKCVFIDTAMYYYRMNKNSITHCIELKNYLDTIEALEDRLDFLSRCKDNELYDMTLKAFELYLIRAINYIFNYNIRHKELDLDIAGSLKEKFRNRLENEVRISNIDKLSKIRFKLFLINRRFYCVLMEILGLGK